MLITWAWPTLIAPLFNKFTPLSDETLKQRTEALLQRCGFSSRGVFVMDGSRRSVHGNAYFTGVGRSKRIVFFDTLLERLQIAEVEAVLAHELGHFRLHHVRSRLLLSLGFGLVGLAAARRRSRSGRISIARSASRTPSPHAALLLFMFVLPAFTYFLTPLGAWWSRKHEFEADEFAAKFADARQLADALVKLYRDNATTLTPDRLHSAFYDSHPPALVRISRLQQLARTDMSERRRCRSRRRVSSSRSAGASSSRRRDGATHAGRAVRQAPDLRVRRRSHDPRCLRRAAATSRRS